MNVTTNQNKCIAVLMFVFLMVIPNIKATVKVACVGNSITYGSGVENRVINSYPAQLQAMLGDGYKVGNFGKPGATLLTKGHRPYIQQVEYEDALDFAGDIVVIHLGVNDTDPRNWPNYRDEFVGDYLDLINSFREIDSEVRILIARMTPISHLHRRFKSGTRDWHEQIQEAIETVAEVAGVQLIDFYEPLYSYPHLIPDAIHPNAQGATRLAECVYQSITGDFGGLQVSSMYSDNMVFQRGEMLNISGVANANDKVSVTIAKQKYSVRAAHNGKWKVSLPPLQAGGPYELIIKTKDTKLSYQDVMVGEVWLCSGQSNMAWMLKQSNTGKADIPYADNPNIRFYDMKGGVNAKKWSESYIDSIANLQYYTDTQWQVSSSDNASDFSAVAYYFGKMLYDSLQVPIGLICNAVGGSPTEAWIDKSALEVHFPDVLTDWTQNDFVQPWVRERALYNLSNSKSAIKRHPFAPAYLYETGIEPLQQYPIKGVIWYQGESNAHNVEAHERLFRLLVDSWRENWDKPELPFYYVQLSSLNRPSWTWFRDSQRRLMKQIPHVGMAVSSDVGDLLDVHPRDKKEVGERLARWALSHDYGKQIVPSGPLCEEVTMHKGVVTVVFEYADTLTTKNSQPLFGFEIAEHEGVYYPANVKIEGNKVILWSDEVKSPHYVRYGWQPFTRANLVNECGLPASTFRKKCDEEK